jgi:hypothetical protein
LTLLRETSGGQTLNFLWQARKGRERGKGKGGGGRKKEEGGKRVLSMKLLIALLVAVGGVLGNDLYPHR